MAKIAFSKLKCKVNEEIKIINFNGEDIEVRQYLPAQDKLALMGRVITQSHEEDSNHANPVKIEIFTHLEILYTYTNITFTEKQKENTPKLYDLVYSSGLLEAVIDAIPEKEYDIVCSGIFDSVEAVYKYYHSALGILDSVVKNGKDTELSMQNIKEILEEISSSGTFENLAPLIGLN